MWDDHTPQRKTGEPPRHDPESRRAWADRLRRWKKLGIRCVDRCRENGGWACRTHVEELYKLQDGRCGGCGIPFDRSRGFPDLDHFHERRRKGEREPTVGMMRGLVCRACNAVLKHHEGGNHGWGWQQTLAHAWCESYLNLPPSASMYPPGRKYRAEYSLRSPGLPPTGVGTEEALAILRSARRTETPAPVTLRDMLLAPRDTDWGDPPDRLERNPPPGKSLPPLVTVGPAPRDARKRAFPPL